MSKEAKHGWYSPAEANTLPHTFPMESGTGDVSGYTPPTRVSVYSTPAGKEVLVTRINDVYPRSRFDDYVDQGEVCKWLRFGSAPLAGALPLILATEKPGR